MSYYLAALAFFIYVVSFLMCWVFVFARSLRECYGDGVAIVTAGFSFYPLINTAVVVGLAIYVRRCKRGD